MKTNLLFLLALVFISYRGVAQCNYIPSTSTAGDTVSYTLMGGSFQSYGCAPIDPNYWVAGAGNTITITFVSPEDYPTFRVWGMNDDDIASVSVNGSSYLLSATTASYDPKVVCGLSPGPDGILFSGGNFVGANDNVQGNYSYQNIQLHTTAVTSITINTLGGAGWGFAGASVNCPSPTGQHETTLTNQQLSIYPNPVSGIAAIELPIEVSNASLEIYNHAGQKVMNLKNIYGKRINYNCENLVAGIYFVSLMTEKEVRVCKLVVEKK